MANELFNTNAQYGNAPAPNTFGTMAQPAMNQISQGNNGLLSGLASFASSLNPTSLIGSAINTIGSLLNRGAERREAQKQRDWNEQMMDKQNDFSLEMWNKTNEYNTPEAQRQRLLDAGLNPIYYGLDGNGNAGAFESAQPLGYDRANLGNMQNPLAAGVQGYQTTKQLELMEAEIANTNANTAKQTEETATEVQRRNKIVAEIEQTEASIKQIMSSANLNDKQREKIDKDLSWLDLLNQATLAEKSASAKLTDSQRNRIEKLLPGEVLLQIKNAEDFEHQWYKIDAEIEKMSKETGLLKKDLQFYALNHMNNGFMGSGLSLPNIWYQGAMKEIQDAMNNQAYEDAKKDNILKGGTDNFSYPANYSNYR